MPECDELLAGVLANNPQVIKEAAKHIAVCPQCRVGLSQLLAAMISDQEDALPCAECRARLPDYLASSAAQIKKNPALRAVHAHLESCAVCQQEYEDLIDTMAALSIQAPERQSGLDEIIKQTMERLLPSTGPLGRSRSALATREPASEGPAQGKTVQCEWDCRPKLPVRLEVKFTRGEDRYHLTVEPVLWEGNKPAVGMTVGLYSGDLPGESCFIDLAQPRAIFHEISLDAGYQLVIEYQGDSVRIPLIELLSCASRD